MYVHSINPYGTGMSSISQNIPSNFSYNFAPTGAGAWQGLVNPALSTWNASLMGINPALSAVNTGLTSGFQASINPAVTGFQSTFNPTLTWGGIATQQGAFASPGLTQPRVDLSETNSDVVVAAELPNINPNNLNLTVTDDSITISASTMGIGGAIGTSIYRTVSLPTDVRAEHCSASYNNGILEVRCPKADLATRRRIQVTS
ncbi:MAG: Hsp20/alpha crystallin family protein [Thermacetogeniaceae bacterium]